MFFNAATLNNYFIKPNHLTRFLAKKIDVFVILQEKSSF